MISEMIWWEERGDNDTVVIDGISPFKQILVYLKRNDTHWLSPMGWVETQKGTFLQCFNNYEHTLLTIPEEARAELTVGDSLTLVSPELGLDETFIWGVVPEHRKTATTEPQADVESSASVSQPTITEATPVVGDNHVVPRGEMLSDTLHQSSPLSVAASKIEETLKAPLIATPAMSDVGSRRRFFSFKLAIGLSVALVLCLGGFGVVKILSGQNVDAPAQSVLNDTPIDPISTLPVEITEPGKASVGNPLLNEDSISEEPVKKERNTKKVMPVKNDVSEESRAVDLKGVEIGSVSEGGEKRPPVVSLSRPVSPPISVPNDQIQDLPGSSPSVRPVESGRFNQSGGVVVESNSRGHTQAVTPPSQGGVRPRASNQTVNRTAGIVPTVPPQRPQIQPLDQGQIQPQIQPQLPVRAQPQARLPVQSRPQVQNPPQPQVQIEPQISAAPEIQALPPVQARPQLKIQPQIQERPLEEPQSAEGFQRTAISDSGITQSNQPGQKTLEVSPSKVPATTENSAISDVVASKLVKSFAPIYPHRAINKVQKDVVVVVHYDINPKGRTENISIIDIDYDGFFKRHFESAAKSSVKKYKFTPRLEGGEPVTDVSRRIKIVFTGSGTDIANTP